jgi:competence protein ComFC
VAADYNGAVKELVLALKFHQLQSAAQVAAELLVEVVPGRPFDAVTSVPIAPSRYRERGYNQSELLAKLVARQLRLPYHAGLARTSSQHQLGLGRAGRLQSVQGAFYAIRTWADQRLLIVDDVVTTGATLEACARELQLAGAGEVWGLAVARR